MAKEIKSIRFEPKMWERLENITIKLKDTKLTNRTSSEIVRQGTLKEMELLEQQLENLK